MAGSLLLILAFSLPVQAQESETLHWRWPEYGLAFDYPADWVPQAQDNFEFILASPTNSFVGLQASPLTDDENIDSVFDEIAGNLNAEITSFELDGVDARSLFIPGEGDGLQARLIGYTTESGTMVLLLFGGSPSEWEAFEPQINALLDSIVISRLKLNTDELDNMLTESFKADETLRLGNADAPVTIVEVIDFSCPHCANYSISIERIIQDYVLPGNAQLTLKLVTFVGQELSEVAVQAEYCAASLGFGWQMHGLLFDIHVNEGSANFTPEFLNEAVAERLDVDTEAFTACLADGTYAHLLEQEQDIIDEYNVTGTPSILFAAGDETPDYIRTTGDEPVRGGVRLIRVYEYLDELLGTDS